MHGKFLFWKIDQFAIWGTHLPKLEFWEAPQDPATLFSGKTSLEKNDLWDQKVIIKGMKFQEAYFMLASYLSILLLRSFVLLDNCNYVTNILTLLIYLRLLLQKNMPAKAAGQGTKPPSWGHNAQAQLLAGRRCRVVYVWMSSSRFLVLDFSEKIFLKDFCAEGTGKTLYDVAERFLPWVWGSPTWQKRSKRLFLSKN